MFQIATWNVNSLRVRLQHVLNWLDENPVDVLALQEIKMVNEDFPETDDALWNKHVAFRRADFE